MSKGMKDYTKFVDRQVDLTMSSAPSPTVALGNLLKLQ